MKKNGPLIIIVFSIILIIGNVIKTDSNTIGFWLRVSTGILLIIAMYFVIRNRKKES
jgi:hypothetical protein